MAQERMTGTGDAIPVVSRYLADLIDDSGTHVYLQANSVGSNLFDQWLAE